MAAPVFEIGYDTASDFDISYTLTGVTAAAGDVIIVGVSGRSGIHNFDIPTWNSETFTQIGAYTSAPVVLEFFALKCASSGSFNIVGNGGDYGALCAVALVYSGDFDASFFDGLVETSWASGTYALPSVGVVSMDADSLAIDFLAATGWNDGFGGVSTTHTTNGTQRELAENAANAVRRLYACEHTGTGTVACSYTKSDADTPQYRIAGFRLFTAGGAGSSIDTLGDDDTNVRVGATEDVTTTGLDTLTTASTIGGKAIASASAPSGDGTITLAGFTDGETYPAMGTQSCIMSDGTLTASANRTLNTMAGWQWVNVVSLDTGDWSVGKAFSGGDMPGQLHTTTDGVMILNPDGTLTNCPDSGTFPCWARMAAGGAYSGGEMVSFQFTVGDGGVEIGDGGITSAGITEAGLTRSGLTS